MISLLNTIIAFVVALGSLVVVHEFGHYLAARICNVKVLRFSVGFGRILASRRLGRDQTEWALAVFPLGGYVKMLDEREGEVAPEDLPRAFNRQSVWRRFLIVVAGPLANFLLAIFVYWLIFMKSLAQPGTYTGVYPFSTHQRWLKNAAQLRNLDELADRVRELEAKLGKDKGSQP